MELCNNLETDTSIPSTSTGRTRHSDSVSVDHQYKNAVKYVRSLAKPLRSQLSSFFHPLIFHVYKDLLSRRKIERARKFLWNDCKAILGAGCYKLVTKELSNIKTVSEFTETSYFRIFCEHKYTIDCSEEALRLFINHLKEKRYRKMLSIVLFNFKFVGNYGDILQSMESENFRQEEAPSLDFENDISLRNEPTSIANERSMYFYSVHCKNQNICAVDVNKNNTFLACGFENASIHLWQLDLNDFEYAENNEIKLGLIVPRDFGNRNKRIKTSAYKGSDIMLRGHKGSVYGVKFSEEYNILLFCSEDCTVKAWTLDDFKVLSSWGDQKYPIWDVAVSPRTDYFVTACKCVADIWNFNRHRYVQSLLGHTSDVDCVRIHANSKYVATASADKTIRIWSLLQNTSVRHFDVGTFVSSIEFSANGKHLVSADDFGTIKIWDIGSEKLIRELDCAHSGRITSVSYNSSSTLLASGGFDETLKIWDIASTESFDPNERRHDRILIDSQAINSELQFVSFRDPNLVLSVATPKNHEDDIVQFL